jgi:hypothetical protein
MQEELQGYQKYSHEMENEEIKNESEYLAFTSPSKTVL